MEIFFTALLCIAIIIVGIIVALALFLKSVKKALSSSGSTPARIHLFEQKNLDWKDKQLHQKNDQEMLSLGFQSVGNYGIREMPALKMSAYVKAREGMIGVLYEMQPVGFWCDVVKYHNDGTSITASSTARGQQLKHRPGHEKIRSAGAGPSKLYSLIRQASNTGPRDIQANSDEFKKLFEKAYADETDWRNSIGGPTEDEIRAIAKASGRTPPDNVIAMTLDIQRNKAATGLIVAFAENYREKHDLSEQAWEDVRANILFVHDNLTQDMCRGILGEAGLTELTEDQNNLLSSLPPREAVRTILTLLDAGETLRKIDELDKPLPVDVYEIVRD